MASLRSINQDDLRNHNLSVVLDTLLRSVAPLSRAELAKATGLTKATMSLLIPLLMSDKVVKEGQPSAIATHGRPSTPLNISSGRFCGIGMQINTDGFGCCVLDLSGDTILERWVEESMGNVDPDSIFRRLDDLVREAERLIAQRGLTVVGSGLALPGLVTADMRLINAHNLGWSNIDLTRFEVVGRLVPRVDNEANMAAIAQVPGFATQRKEGGVVGPTDSFIYISTDIGIGGALVREGRIVTGNHGFAGELGHISVSLDGPLCRCGRHGCLESYAGRRALVESAGIAKGDQTIRIEAIDELLKRWNSGETTAVAVVDRAVEAMASGIASTINILDVDMVILGGLWERFGGVLARNIEDKLNAQVLGYPEARPHVLTPRVNMRPALVGAAEVGLRRFLDDPLAFLAQ